MFIGIFNGSLLTAIRGNQVLCDERWQPDVPDARREHCHGIWAADLDEAGGDAVTEGGASEERTEGVDKLGDHADRHDVVEAVAANLLEELPAAGLDAVPHRLLLGAGLEPALQRLGGVDAEAGGLDVLVEGIFEAEERLGVN